LQARDEAAGVGGFGAAAEVVGAEVAVAFAADQHVVGGGRDRGGERADCFFAAAAGAQAMKLRLEIASLFTRRGPGALAQGGF
jgi:hypothetical protein